jgi:hypothetical protein
MLDNFIYWSGGTVRGAFLEKGKYELDVTIESRMPAVGFANLYHGGEDFVPSVRLF